MDQPSVSLCWMECMKLNSGLLQTFTDVVQFAHNDEQFLLLSGLLVICGTLQASNAKCKGGFSLMTIT